jgi:hypothetical protein
MLNFAYRIDMEIDFSQYLEKFYLNWQMKNGRASIREFSRWLDINHAMVDQWMNGKGKPGPKSIPKLARKLGLEIYDIFEIPRPPRVIHDIESIYDTLPHTDRAEFEDDFDHWLAEWLKEHGFKRIK